MDVVCEACGGVGLKNRLLRCRSCKNAARHGCCLDMDIYETLVEWLCDDCQPKHIEAIKSLEDMSNQRQFRRSQLDSSIINESNMKKEKVIKGLCPSGHRRNRPCEERKDRSDASTKHFLNGDTSSSGRRRNILHKARRYRNDTSTKQFLTRDAYSSEMFIREISKRTESEKKGEDKNKHLSCVLGSVDGPSNSALDHASKIEKHINLQKPMGHGFKTTLNSMEWPNFSKEKDSCFSPSKYTEGSIPQGRKDDLFSLPNDVERSHPLIADKSSPTLARVEQADASSPTLAIVEKNHPPKAVEGLVNKPKSVLGSKFSQNHSKPMQGSDLKTGNADILNPSKECVDSWAKVAKPSSTSNEREDSTVKKNGAERTKCLGPEKIFTPTLENHKGSKHSMAKECFLSKEGNSHKANRRSKELLLSTKDTKMQKKMSGEVHCSCYDPSERGNSWKVNEISNPKSAEGDHDGRNPQCNAGQDSSPAGKKVVCKQALQVEGVNSKSFSSKCVSPCESAKVNPRKRHSQSSSQTPHETKYQKANSGKKNKNVNAAQSKSGRSAASLQDNQNMPGIDNIQTSLFFLDNGISQTPHETNYQKAKFRKNKNVNAARSKSGRPGASLKDNQNMPGRGNGGNHKVSKYSKLGKDKKMDNSRLCNKVSSDLQKRARVTNVLQPSSLHKSSVGKSIPCSENIDLVLKESNCPLNNPRSSCARRVTEVDQMVPSRQFDHTYSGTFLEAYSKTKEVHEANDTEPKKLKRLILPYDEDEDEDAEAMQVKDLNPRSCDNDAQDGVKNQGRYVEKSEEALQPGNLNHQSFKNHAQMKQRSIEANEDGNAIIGDLNDGCPQNDILLLASQTVVAEKHCGLSRMPLISEYICGQPIGEPYWTGIMKIGRDYIPLAAHLSTKARKKVRELSRSLPPIMKVTKPKRWEASIPTADSIGLYFCSLDMRPNKELDQLVKYVTDGGFVLETVVGLSKLLVFPSIVLPEEYQMFQGKHYLWGMFKCREDKGKRFAPVGKKFAALVTEEEQVQEQHVLDQQDKEQCDTLDQEMPFVKHVVHSENQPLLEANQYVGKEALPGNDPHSAEINSAQVHSECFQQTPVDQKENAQEFACSPGSNASPPVEPYHNSGYARVSANISPADQGQPCSNLEAPPTKLCGFVVSQTPRSLELIREMQNEGALLFTMQGLIKPGPMV